MTNIFSQSQNTYKLHFLVHYKNVEIFDELFAENSLSLSAHEVESKTVDSMPDDIWRIEVLFDDEPSHLINIQISDHAKLHNSELLSEITIEKIEDKDWVSLYHENLKPLEVGNFFIASRREKNNCPKDKQAIFIDAARAFGTGEHATTAGSIEAMSELHKINFKKILDIGTGTGILSFAAEKLWPNADITGCDIEAVAIDIAKDNAIFNESSVKFFQNKEDEILSAEYKSPKFDLIISNILAQPLIEMSEEIKNILTPGGYLIISGFLNNQLPKIAQAYKNIGLDLLDIREREGWCITTLKLLL